MVMQVSKHYHPATTSPAQYSCCDASVVSSSHDRPCSTMASMFLSWLTAYLMQCIRCLYSSGKTSRKTPNSSGSQSYARNLLHDVT